MTMMDDPAMRLAQAAMDAHRHNTRLLMALRETQLEQGEKLAEHDRRFDAIDRRFEAIDRRFEAVEGRLGAIEGELSSIKNTMGRVAVGMYTLEKLIRRIVPEDDEPN